MKYVQKLGKSFSKLCFGGAGISGEGRGYGFGEIGQDQAVELLQRAYEHGVNIFDFAPIYGFNLAEKRAGAAFREVREKVSLVSKCGVNWSDSGRVDMSNDPNVALKMLDNTLRNFQSDYVDIYMVHWPDPRVDIRSTMEVLYNAKEKGKILHLGLCNTSADELRLAKEVSPVEVVQGELNLFQRDAFRALGDELDDSILTMGWGTFDKGILAGSVKEDSRFTSDDCRSWAPWWKKSNWKERAAFTDKAMKNFKLSSRDLARLSLQFSQSEADTSLCGMRGLEHLERNLEYLVAPELKNMEEIVDEFSRF